MVKKMTRSSLSKSSSPKNDFVCQNLLSNPGEETCFFTDYDFAWLKRSKFFPKETIFRPFDLKARSDMISKRWVCFPAAPFKVGFSYPFPPLVNDFFRRTGMSYIQAMPMVWRILYVVNYLVTNHAMDFGLEELASVYEIKAHGSSRYLFKVRPGQDHLVLKTTRNNDQWKKQFFFVERSSIEGGNKLPYRWVTGRIKFTEVATPTPETEKKVKLFFAHSEQERTFGNQNQDPESTSIKSESQSNMSGKGVRRPASAFALDDIDSMMASKKAKKEIGSSSMPTSTPPATRGKSQTKKKKLTDSVDSSLLADVDPLDAHKLIQKGVNILVRAYDEITVENAEMIRQVTELKRVNETNQLLLKEKLEALNKSNKLLLEAKTQHAQELEDTISQTKKSAALTVYQARIKMFEEASEPGFDKAKWDVETWRKYVAELGGEGEMDKVDDSGLDKGVGEVDEGDKMVAVQDDDGKKDKA